jgi:hypothetical protein
MQMLTETKIDHEAQVTKLRDKISAYKTELLAKDKEISDLQLKLEK